MCQRLLFHCTRANINHLGANPDVFAVTVSSSGSAHHGDYVTSLTCMIEEFVVLLAS